MVLVIVVVEATAAVVAVFIVSNGADKVLGDGRVYGVMPWKR